MNQRLFLETECEHGEYDNGHWVRDSHPYNTAADWCGGGERRVVTVDYEAAARAQYEFHKRLLEATAKKAEKIMLLPGWEELDETDREARVNSLRLPITAALGLAETEAGPEETE